MLAYLDLVDRQVRDEIEAAAGRATPDEAAGTLVLVRDGAMSAAELDDLVAVRAALLRTVRSAVAA